MTISWGISALSHDAAITVMDGEYILFAAHAERYSRIKNDAFLNDGIVQEALSYGIPEQIFWYERPYLKKTRQAFAGQWNEVFKGTMPKSYIHKNFPLLKNVPIKYIDHHKSHAAAGFFTSPFEEARIIVVDGIGEWDTATIWEGDGNKLKKLHSVKYPSSLGIFYSAITQRVGLKPLEDEYILMGMAAYGDRQRAMQLRIALEDDFFNDTYSISLKKNLHRGILDWKPELKESDYPSLALAAQQIVEFRLGDLFSKACSARSNVVFMGGVALNCVANSELAAYCKKLWIMPNPGDAGSSMGAVLAGKRTRAAWEGPYLGTNIDKLFDYEGALRELVEGSGIIAIANGRAEFGPRALGNRSLIADPRGQHMKDRVNDIKHRQRFRPFAPVIMEEFAHEYFKFPLDVDASPYMQFTGTCKSPAEYPAICHADNTSRIQTVTRDQNPVLYNLLNLFHHVTGCPMLLNTSLNIKGQPLVNTWQEALEFGKLHNVKVF